jgi:hypothetical protein
MPVIAALIIKGSIGIALRIRFGMETMLCHDVVVHECPYDECPYDECP